LDPARDARSTWHEDSNHVIWLSERERFVAGLVLAFEQINLLMVRRIPGICPATLWALQRKVIAPGAKLGVGPGEFTDGQRIVVLSLCHQKDIRVTTQFVRLAEHLREGFLNGESLDNDMFRER
jgi:hypothetical protein